MDRTTNNSKRTILQIDDQPVCGFGLQRILARAETLTIVKTSIGLEELNESKCPDVVVIEISVARAKGIGAIKDLKRKFPETSILVLTSHDEILFAERCLKAGAKGYLMKTAKPAEITAAVDDMASGNLHISNRIRKIMLERLSGSRNDQNGSEIDNLSDRELLIVQHIGQSKNNKEIAHELQISIKTIESHRSRIKAKLRLSSPNELVRYAMRLHHTPY